MLFLRLSEELICSAPLLISAPLSCKREDLLSFDRLGGLLIWVTFFSVKIVRLLRPLRCFLLRIAGELAVVLEVASLKVGDLTSLAKSTGCLVTCFCRQVFVPLLISNTFSSEENGELYVVELGADGWSGGLIFVFGGKAFRGLVGSWTADTVSDVADFNKVELFETRGSLS